MIFDRFFRKTEKVNEITDDRLLTSCKNIHRRSHSRAQYELFTCLARRHATIRDDAAFENQSSPSVKGWLDDRAGTGRTGHDTENARRFFQHPGGPVVDRSLVNNKKKKRKRDRKFRCKLDIARDDQPVRQMLVQLQFA